jgi:hypothetical protein
MLDDKNSLAKKQGWTPEEIALARGYIPPAPRGTIHLPIKAKRGRKPKNGQ